MANVNTQVRPQVQHQRKAPTKNTANRPANTANRPANTANRPANMANRPATTASRPAVAGAQVSLAKSAESGAEERTFGVQHKKSEFENKLEKKGSERRKSKIKQIQRVQNLLMQHQNPKDLANSLRNNSDSMAGLNEVYAGSHEEGNSPVMVLAAIELTEKSQTLSKTQKDNLTDFKDRLIDNHSTEILSWKHSVDGVREKIKSPELADQVLQLIGKSNTVKPGYWQTFVDIMQVGGKENFKSVTDAYVGALNDDTKKSVASTNHGYLSDTLGKVSKFSKAKNMVALGEEAAATLIKKFSDVEKNGMDFLKAAMQVSGDTGSQDLDNVATGYMGLGDHRKQAFASKVGDFLKTLPHGLWDTKEQQFGVFRTIADYTSDRGLVSVASNEGSMRRKLEAMI